MPSSPPIGLKNSNPQVIDMKDYNTRLLTPSPADIAEATAILRQGELVWIPPSTIYGLAADATNEAAVAGIFKAKGRPQDNPLIVHISEVAEITPYVAEFPAVAKRLADKFWPGPLTVILPRSEQIPASVSAGLSTVAIRIPAHPVARAIIKAAGCPLAAPSGNLSGSPSPTTAAHMLADMAGRIPAIVDGGDSQVGVESTVVAIKGDKIRVLRPGGVTPEMLQQVAPAEVASAVTNPLEEGAVAASPGMKYKHYAPQARVVLVKGSPAAFAAFVGEKAATQEGLYALCFDGEEEGIPVPCLTYGGRADAADQAHRLFTALRQLDDTGARLVYAACPSPEGVGLAVYNRILRAAGFEVITLDG